jgi:hypothetical protein
VLEGKVFSTVRLLHAKRAKLTEYDVFFFEISGRGGKIVGL